MTTATPAWRVPTALVALVLIPVVAGSFRIVQLAGGPELIPAETRFDASPVPLVVHIVTAIGYAVLGAFQFSARFRRRRPGWHRAAGRLLVPLGLAVAISALWLTTFTSHPAGSGDLLHVFRLLAASGMAVSIVLGVGAIRRRDIATHQAWMTRAYAIAVAAGTQAFTQGFGEAVFGVGQTRTALMIGAGWVINLAVAEWVIRRRPARPGNRGRPDRRTFVTIR